MKKTIELPIEFFNSLVTYLEETARESVVAARGVRAAIEYVLKEGESLEQDTSDTMGGSLDAPDGHENVDEQKKENNVLEFPVDNSDEPQ